MGTEGSSNTLIPSYQNWKEIVLAYFWVFSLHIQGGNMENHKNLRSAFELDASEIQALRFVTAVLKSLSI
jgi:hypothetical protein